MMIEQVSRQTKILEGPMALGRSCIDDSTLTVDGTALPAWLTLDARTGTVERVTPTADDRTLYTFAFEHFRPTVITVTADKAQIAADGAELLTLTVTSEDAALTSVPIAVKLLGVTIGAIPVALVGGVGEHQMTISEAGRYTFAADETELESTWQIPAYTAGNSAIVEAV